MAYKMLMTSKMKMTFLEKRPQKNEMTQKKDSLQIEWPKK